MALVPVSLVGKENSNWLPYCTLGIDCHSGDDVSQGNIERKETLSFTSSVGTSVPQDGIQG